MGKPKTLRPLQTLLQGPGKTYRAGLVHSEEGGARLWVWGYRDAIAMGGTISWR